MNNQKGAGNLKKAMATPATLAIFNHSVISLVENLLKWLLSVAGLVALLMLILGGIMYMTSFGDERKVETAKKMVTWTILGLVLILASYAILTVISQILT